MPKKYNKVHIEISNVCNLQCTFCPEVIRTKKLMDVVMFENIIRQVAPITDQVCFHLMGEPLLHPDFEKFVEICGEYQTPIFLTSNGVLLTERRAQILLHPAFRQINFSLHSFHNNYPHRDPTEYLERIFSLTEQALTQRPELYINYRLWNLKDPQNTHDKNNDMLARVEERFSFKLDRNIDITRQKSKKIKNRLYLHFDTEFIWPSLDLPILGERGTCHGLSSHFGILADGTVVPCCLDKEGNIPLGQVEGDNLLEILASEKAQIIFQGFRDNKLKDPLCQRCQYITRFEV